MKIKEEKIAEYLIGLFGITIVLGQNPPSDSSSSLCTPATSCGDCITFDPNCAWCKMENAVTTRCDIIENLETRCRTEDIVNPTKRMNIIKNKKLSDPRIERAEVVQVVPQEINLRLRPGIPYELTLKFRQAKDYPVDLYYIMDLSQSMLTSKKKLAELGDALANEMSKITSNFSIGFGSFVDKVVLPFVSTVPEKLIKPCPTCDTAPYGFKNHMPLNRRTEEFKVKVEDAPISGNLDAPEGGLDAIMQAMVCEQQIGWRKDSRKLLVFSTDSGYHIAGDGKLGGIIKPNDEECHLTNDGLYSETNNMDYPSVGQIKYMVRKKKVNVIFAVTADQVSIYEQLSQTLEGATTGKLDADSKNIVDLIRDQYQNITSSVSLKDNANTEYIKVSYYSRCINGSVVKETSVCEGLKVGTTVLFNIKIEVKSCPKKRAEWNQKFTIYPVGLNEALTVNLNMICECDCERPDKEERNSPKCTEGNGTFECGICSCNNKRYGHLCECDETTRKENDDESCKATNSTIICSGRGTCNCGKCSCSTNKKGWEGIYGTYCQCDHQACRRHEDKLCSGNGDCACNECKCYDGWIGSACECSTSEQNCIAQGTDIVCSGFGDCICGKCYCISSSGERRSGKYCDICPTCEGTCSRYRPCVLCKQFQTGEYDAERCKNCTLKMDVVDKVEEEEGEKLCSFKDADDCRVRFVYGYSEQNLSYVRVEKTKECMPLPNVLTIAMGVVGGIVAVGLCLLIAWKVLTTIHDRREFIKFEKERQLAKFDSGENPLYKQATTNFENPTFSGN